MRVTDELIEPLRALLLSAKVLHQNAEGCAVNHYGSDFEIHGLPGWLAECQRDIKNGETALAALEAALAVEPADEITRLTARVAELEEVLAWYGEQARLARLIHSGGDAGRAAIADDGGKRAKAALESKP